MVEKEKTTEKKLIVVQELPTQAMREVQTPEGENYECMTITEALTEIVETIRELKKKI